MCGVHHSFSNRMLCDVHHSSSNTRKANGFEPPQHQQVSVGLYTELLGQKASAAIRGAIRDFGRFTSALSHRSPTYTMPRSSNTRKTNGFEPPQHQQVSVGSYAEVLGPQPRRLSKELSETLNALLRRSHIRAHLIPCIAPQTRQTDSNPLNTNKFPWAFMPNSSVLGISGDPSGDRSAFFTPCFRSFPAAMTSLTS